MQTHNRDEALRSRSAQVMSWYSDRGVRRVTVGAVAVRSTAPEPELLVLRRAAHLEYGGIDELPSGGVHTHETIGEALARELYEETGLRLVPPSPFVFEFLYPTTNGFTIQLNFLVRVSARDEVQLSDEHESYRWVPMSQIAATDLTPNIKQAISQADLADYDLSRPDR